MPSPFRPPRGSKENFTAPHQGKFYFPPLKEIRKWRVFFLFSSLAEESLVVLLALLSYYWYSGRGCWSVNLLTSNFHHHFLFFSSFFWMPKNVASFSSWRREIVEEEGCDPPVEGKACHSFTIPVLPPPAAPGRVVGQAALPIVRQDSFRHKLHPFL